MNKFVVGMVTGGALLMAGAEYMMMNKTARRKMMTKGKKIVDKAESALEDLSAEMFWCRRLPLWKPSLYINKFVRKNNADFSMKYFLFMVKYTYKFEQ